MSSVLLALKYIEMLDPGKFLCDQPVEVINRRYLISSSVESFEIDAFVPPR